MNSPTKIVVLHMKEIIYTVILVVLALIFIILFSTMFLSSKKKSDQAQETYNPGVYTSTLTLNNTNLELEVAVDKSHINSIQLTNLDETITTMYPLIEPAVSDLSKQVCKNQSLDHIDIPKESAYTSQLLLQAIQEALNKAAAN